MKNDCKQLADRIRRVIIETAHGAGNQGVHIGGALSMVEILAVLYGEYDITDYSNPNRNRVVLSKGHDCLGLYATLNVMGVISDDEIKMNFLQDGGFLPTHPVKNIKKGIECSSGSLGQGISFAVGLALANKIKNITSNVFVIVGDGECNEGSCWEAMMSANQYKLDNLIMIVDRNGFQSDGAVDDIMKVDLLSAISAMGWNVLEVDGHNVDDIYSALRDGMKLHDGPVAIVANTQKGHGVSFMENNNLWHHGHLSEEQYKQAMEEIK